MDDSDSRVERVESRMETIKRPRSRSKYDTEVGLSYLNVRYYDGVRGQFLRQDSVHLLLGDASFAHRFNRLLQTFLSDPQQLNSYSYVRNNPIVFKDPAGKFTIDISGNYQQALYGPFGVSGSIGIRFEIGTRFGYQLYYSTGAGVGEGASAQLRIDPIGTLDPAGEYSVVEGATAVGWHGGSAAVQTPFNPSNPFNFTSDEAKVSAGPSIGLRSGVNYSHVVLDKPKYLFGSSSTPQASASTVQSSVYTNNTRSFPMNQSFPSASTGSAPSSSLQSTYSALSRPSLN